MFAGTGGGSQYGGGTFAAREELSFSSELKDLFLQVV